MCGDTEQPSPVPCPPLCASAGQASEIPGTVMLSPVWLRTGGTENLLPVLRRRESAGSCDGWIEAARPQQVSAPPTFQKSRPRGRVTPPC